MKLAKDAPIRSRAYLDHVRSLACAWCSRPPPSEASHHPAQGHGSVGAKCCDLRAIPLCHECHASYHQHGAIGRYMSAQATREWVETTIVNLLREWVRERGCV